METCFISQTHVCSSASLDSGSRCVQRVFTLHSTGQMASAEKHAYIGWVGKKQEWCAKVSYTAPTGLFRHICTVCHTLSFPSSISLYSAVLDCRMGLPRGPVIEGLRSKSFHKHRCGCWTRGVKITYWPTFHSELCSGSWEPRGGRSLRKQLSSSSTAFDFDTFKVNCVHYFRFEGFKSWKIDCTTVFPTVIVDPLSGMYAPEHAGQHVMS